MLCEGCQSSAIYYEMNDCVRISMAEEAKVCLGAFYAVFVGAE